MRSHPSSIRAFEEIPLGPLSPEDTSRVIEMGLIRAAQQNNREMTIAPDAKKILVDLSEGFPHFIQQFCGSAFDADGDWVIGKDDVEKSAFGEGGALDLIGKRYYHDTYYNKIRQDAYRRVLRIMAKASKEREWITKDEIRRSFGRSVKLDNAIHTLRELNFIVAKEGERGSYRLVHRGFALWIQMFTKASLQEVMLDLRESLGIGPADEGGIDPAEYRQVGGE